MAQKFHRVRNGMADKDTLEVCFAIDSDEDRDVVAEVDNTEGRTSEDEVPPQVCKNTAKKSHVIMQCTKKRVTAFNAFCSEKQKDDPQIGLGCKLWSKEWQSMGPAERENYKKKAKGLSLKGFSPDKCFRNILKMIKEVKQNADTQYQSMCIVGMQNNTIFCRGFGPLATMLGDPTLHSLLMDLAFDQKKTEKKETTITLRQKVKEKLSVIAKRDLGLNQFPYKKLQRGEFEVNGIPESLLPLHPPVHMSTKQLKELMQCKITIKRVSATHDKASHRYHPEDASKQTHYTQHTVTLHHTDTIQQTDHTQHTDIVNHADTVHQRDHIDISHGTDTIPQIVHTGIVQQIDHADTSHHTDTIQQTDHTQHTVDHTDTVQPRDHIDTSQLTDTIAQIVHTGIMQQTEHAQDTGNTWHRDISQDAVQSQVQIQTDGHVLSMDFTLESLGGTWQQSVSDDSHSLVSGNTFMEKKIVLGEDPQQITVASVQLVPTTSQVQPRPQSENPQQITGASVQLVPATSQVQPKPKRPRVAWNSEALKALEESVGPLNALGGSLPGFARLEQIRNSTQVLQKYSVEQIYQKIYKTNYKK